MLALSKMLSGYFSGYIYLGFVISKENLPKPVYRKIIIHAPARLSVMVVAIAINARKVRRDIYFLLRLHSKITK